MHRRCVLVTNKNNAAAHVHRAVVLANSWGVGERYTPDIVGGGIGDTEGEEDNYYDLDADLDSNGTSSNEVVRLPGYLETASRTWEKRWFLGEKEHNGTEAWVMNLYNRDPGPQRWTQMQQDAVGVVDVLFRFPAVNYGSAKGCGLSHMKAGKWLLKALLPIPDKRPTQSEYPNVTNHPRLLSDKGLYMLEDDCLFKPDNAKARWQQAVDDLPNDADMLVGGVHWADSSATRILPHLVKLKDFSATQQCLFCPSAYSKLEGFAKSHEVNIDRYMGALAREGKLNVYCVLPFTSTQRPGTSHLRAGATDDTGLFTNTEQALLRLPVVVGANKPPPPPSAPAPLPPPAIASLPAVRSSSSVVLSASDWAATTCSARQPPPTPLLTKPPTPPPVLPTQPQTPPPGLPTQPPTPPPGLPASVTRVIAHRHSTVVVSSADWAGDTICAGGPPQQLKPPTRVQKQVRFGSNTRH